ncbi:MAG: AAA family ATPase [Ignavibacteria bacterium]
MELLEQEKYLNRLGEIFCSVKSRNGFLAVISGEAGIGKTSRVKAFTKEFEDKARILWGACDALFTPSPLGPFMILQIN